MEESTKPTFKLDGKSIPFEPGDTIIGAAHRQGIEIPHYCWHPGLSIAANCRMCLVEVKAERPMKLPVMRWDAEKQDFVDDLKTKLVPACQTPAAPNMEVLSQNEDVKKAQSAVQEFLLLNHPVDCPICDQAGECKLQDYWLEHQTRLKRKPTEPVHKPKAVRFGPTIVYDAERCIMCTRCIRFCDEVVGDHVLDMRERGNRNEITVSPGRELDHKYTLMTEHVCPVGALTSRDFRFKARVWFLKAAPSVCDGCATGCNMWVDFDPRSKRIERLRPRENEGVNKYWMCDDGMMRYHQQTVNRVLEPQEGRGVQRRTLARAEALHQVESLIRSVDGSKIAVVLHAASSNEDNFVMGRLGRDILKTQRVYLASRGEWEGDTILRDKDNNPNRQGALKAALGTLGQAPSSLEQLSKDIENGSVQAVIALGGEVMQSEAQLEGLKKVPVVVFDSNDHLLTQLASIVIPTPAHGECSGSFTNRQGMTQYFKRAVPAPSGIDTAWETIVEIVDGLKVSGWDKETIKKSFAPARQEGSIAPQAGRVQEGASV